MTTPTQAPATPPRPGAAAATPPRVISSRDLLAGGKELVIRHEQTTYHLRLTGSNKLILTK